MLVTDERIKVIGYEPRKLDLEIVFTEGDKRLYIGVPATVYLALMQAENKAEFFAKKIENTFVYHSFK